MTNVKKSLLPIGSVVTLQNSATPKPLMIYGRKQTAVSDGVLWDYISVPYPQGNSDERHTYLFNHNQVKTLLFIGFQTEEEEKLQEFLAELNDEEKKKINDK